MIRIRKIVLRNFKSFKKADIPVSNGFTAIVGSNGSGKSNILDAFLFVFGINSLKALRASRMTDLVNNQSKDDYAKVEIDIEDTDKKKTFSISRTIDKHGKSVMRVDDKRVTLSEVSNLLEEIGIKPYGHNIVVQGDVTRIVEMNGIERREMIDEVAGIREFDDRKAEAQKELEKVDTRIKEVRIVVSERETQLEQLSKDRQAALRAKALEKELSQTKATLFKVEMERMTQQLEASQTRSQKLNAEKEEREARLLSLREELVGIEQSVEDANRELVAASQRTFSEIGMLVEEKKSEKRVHEERLSARRAQLEKTMLRIEQLRIRLGELDSAQAEKEEQLLQKEVQVHQIESQLKELESKMHGAQTDMESKSRELKELERELESLEESAQDQTRAFFERQSQVQTLRKTQEVRKGQFSEWHAEHEKLSQRIDGMAARESELGVLHAKYPNPVQSHKEILQKIESLVQEVAYAKSALDTASKALMTLAKTSSKCPTCDSALSESLKQKVLAAKQSDEKRFSQAIAAAQSKKGELLEQKSTLESVIEKQRALESFIAPLKELRQKQAEINQRMQQAAGDGLDESRLAAMETELSELENRMARAHSAVDDHKQSIAQWRAQNGFVELQRLSEQRNVLTRSLHSVLGAKKEIELQSRLVLHEEKEGLLREEQRLQAEQAELKELVQTEGTQLESIEKELDGLNARWKKADEQTRALDEKKNKLLQKQLSLREKIDKDTQSIREGERKLTELEVEKGKLEVRLADIRAESSLFEGIETLAILDSTKLRARIPEIEKEISRLGAINQKALDSFGEYEREMLEIKKKSDRLEEERLAVIDLMQKIEDRRTHVFMDCFEQIHSHFREMHFLLGEGSGKLELENPASPLESGLLIEASLKGKEIHNIDSMSGGEKTLTALAFLFAIQLYDAAPFYIFDEADAALDKENSAKLGRIIAKISSQNQFIGITHNDTVVKQANQIIGVALNEQKSSVVGLRLKEAASAAS